MKLNILEKINQKEDPLIKIADSIATKDWNKYFESKVKKDEFYKKFKIGTCYVYASNLYFIIILRWINLIPFNKILLRIGSSFIPFRKRIIYVSAFITLIDEVVDNIFFEKKKDRLKEIFYGNSKVKGKLKLLREISKELMKMGADLNPSLDWADCEDKNLQGEEDPDGLCYRAKGITLGNELGSWAINANQKEKSFLEKCAFLIQMIDDIIDIKEDKKNNIKTPATEKIWNEKTLINQFNLVRNEALSRIKSKSKIKLIKKAIDWKMNWVIDLLEKN